MKRFNVLQSLTVLFIFSLMVWGLVPSVAEGSVPQLINFQGILKDGSGNPVANGSYSVTFTIYEVPTGGTALWTETQSVTTSSGLFTVLLGSTTPVPDSVFYDSSRYLGMAVSPDGEMTPRQRLSSVGYSYVSSQWTSAGQNLFTLSGKVGIGESNPLNTLTIGSNGGFTSTGLFPGILMGTTSFQTKQLIIGRDENNFVQLAYADGDPVSAARLLVEGNHPLSISTGGSLYLNTGGNNSIFVSTSGDVGIGTTSPTKKLDVVGSIKTSDTLFASNVSSNSPLRLQTAGTTRMYIDDVTGNVGIGTTAPRGNLDVAVGNLHVSGTAAYGIIWGDYGGPGMLAHIHRWFSDNRLYVTNNGINNLTGVYLVSGGTSWISTSDRRLKENIKEAAYGLSTVLRIPVREYNIKGSHEKKIGFVAQEIYSILPEIVSKGDDGEFTASSSPWGIDYAGLTPVLVKAIQEQQKEIQELKAAIEKLQVERR